MRYPLSLPVVYSDGRASRRSGRTLDISSSGLRLTTPERPLQPGKSVLVSISLPGRCDGSVPVTLTLHGCVVRASREEAAVQLDRYDFEAPGCSGDCRACAKAPDARKGPGTEPEATQWSVLDRPALRQVARTRGAGGA